MGAHKTTEKPKWRATALAIAAAALLGFSASDASALGLGRITVQSALGEPLRAEIDIPEINAEELASLRTSVASPEAFRAAGLEYNPTVSNLKITLERRADGRHFLRLVSARPVNEPFVDLILETQWAAGRIVRDYTMLFDPPSMRAPAAPLAAQITPAPSSPSAAAPRAAASPAPSQPARAAVARAPSEPRAATARPPRAAGVGGSEKQVTVQSGDTAGKIAAQFKPANVSLDQMLVALLRANPDAFINGNINRLRAGAVMDVPGSDEANLVPAGEARQTLVAQSRDFNEFRRKLAEGAPTTRAATSDRQATGRVQAQVEEKRPGATAPDKLQLSKGSVQARAAEDKIARDRAAQDSASRVAELNKNIADLNRVGTASAPAGSGASAARPGVALPLGTPVGTASAARPASATAPAAVASAARPVAAPPSIAPTPAPVPVPAAATIAASAAAAARPASAAVATPVIASASAARPASGPATTAVTPVPAAAASSAAAPATPSATTAAALAPGASAPASSAAAAASPASATNASASAAKPVVPTKPPAPAPVETSLIDDMLENPIVPATLGGILALLLGFGIYRAQQRKKSTQVDSSFLESRLQPDSFFGASGGQRIDTNEGGATGSSMVYSPSQLDAAGDVDPVAEADVYLAYGRDLQAEEILKEAMRTQPQRVAIHSKLLEIYSKRRDGKAFEQVATEAHGLTHGEGPEWEHICELGKELDPSNALYRPGGSPSAVGIPSSSMATQAFSASTQPMASAHLPAAQPQPAPDFDLDLDFSLDDPVQGSTAAPLTASSDERTQAIPAVAQQAPALDMDFGDEPVSLNAPPVNTPAPVSQTETVRLDAPDLMLDPNSLSFTTEPPKPAPAPVAVAKPPATDTGMIEFDLGALSLDLGPDTQGAENDDAPVSTAGSPLGADNSANDPLATKLALAEEFNAIGDPEGARSLAEEVVAEATGDLKNRAQRFLAEIS
ncbi:FimV/HubP family polar landmark protein [Caenimonas sp. SL110]|uniref:FimV/HubP family polar landmark protein n=1 Tax=Caenimonas sp. SL110 TaxID=1450524 RepID=UPI001EE6F441|nr:FimV/HubP family polar landmark protein [Caenimonas sp. SL110]